MSNIGKIINDFYCNGFFGRDYDLSGAEIIAEGEDWIVIRKTNGLVDFCSFQTYDHLLDQDNRLTGEIQITGGWDKQELINEWCSDDFEL